MFGASAVVTEPAQLRWSVVRLTDLVQSLERENADIRRQNKVLATSGSKALIGMRDKALETCAALRNDLTGIRQDMERQMEVLANKNQKVLKKSFQMFGEIIKTMKEDQRGVRANADDLSKDLAKLHRDLASKDGYLGMLKKVVSRLRQDVGDLQELKEQMMQEKVESKMRIEDLLRALGDVTSKEQAASIEVRAVYLWPGPLWN
jgi:chromosome segregation ATPase